MGSMLSTRHFECFLSIVESGSFSHSAIRLGCSQPALSRYVKELEQELKVLLLYRDGRGIVLTEAGQRFLPRAVEILAAIDRARREAQDVEGVLESVAVGMPPTVTRILSLHLANAIYATYPNIKLRLIESFSGHLLEWLSADRMDAAILYTSEATQRLNATPLLLERLYLVAPAGGPPLPAQIDLRAVADLPLILPSRPHGLRRLLETIALRQGLKLTVKIEADGLVPIVQLVGAGMGYTVLPKPSIQAELDSNILASSLIVNPAVERTLVVATAMKTANRANTETLIRIIKKQIEALDTQTGWSLAPLTP